MANYIADQQRAARDIKKAGRQVTLLIPTPSIKETSGFERNSTANRGEDIEVKIDVLGTTFDRKLIDGNHIRTSDIRFIIAGDVQLSNSYKIRDTNGQTYEIRGIESVDPGDTIIIHKVHCR